jgi:hypothetical protein
LNLCEFVAGWTSRVSRPRTPPTLIADHKAGAVQQPPPSREKASSLCRFRHGTLFKLSLYPAPHACPVPVHPTAPIYNTMLAPRPLCLLTSRLNFSPRHARFAIPLWADSPRRALHSALWPPIVVANLLVALWAYKVCLSIRENAAELGGAGCSA